MVRGGERWWGGGWWNRPHFLPSAIGPKNPRHKVLGPATTPRKRPAAQMSSSPESETPATPTPSVVASPASRLGVGGVM